MEPGTRIKITKRFKHCCLETVCDINLYMQVEHFTVPGTLDGTLRPQDLVRNLQKLQLEHHQTIHLHCVKILFDHEMKVLPLHPECIKAYY